MDSVAALGFRMTLTNVAPEFEATCAVRSLGSVSCLDVSMSQVEIRRTMRDVASSPMEALFVLEQRQPTQMLYRVADHDISATQGDLILSDADLPCDTFTNERFRHRVWVFPRTHFNGPEFDLDLRRGARLPRDAPFTRLLVTYLHELASQAPHLDDKALRAAGDAAGRLVAASHGVKYDENLRTALAGGRLAVVKAMVRRRLEDPLLSPARVAGACGISVRKLHQLFEGADQTFSQYVMQQRLQRAHASLKHDAAAAGPIADLAFSLGFNSVATFYRAYRAAFDQAPGDTRRIWSAR